MFWSSGIDVDKLVAIDVHVHAGRSASAAADVEAAPRRDDTLARSTERMGVGGQTPDETAAYYRERKMACCMWGVDTGGSRPSRPGSVSNDEMLEAAQRNNDVFIPFVMVDPWRADAGTSEAQRLIEAGARGFKFHPPGQGFYANDRRMYSVYEVIAAARLPALFHTGQTAVGQGTRAGGGIRLKYGNPEYLDDVSVDFPEMPIIMAHPSFPWQEEALAIAQHKANVYIDLSGWSPKYFPPLLVQYSNTLLKNKVLFGSDHPMITSDRWMQDFEGAGFRDEVKPLLFKENAARLLGLRDASQ
jgi:predicted TIM-barrel fold metal-dependent hydrolase